MARTSSDSAERHPSRFDNAAARERYVNVVAAKNIWEKQGFLYVNVIHKRLADLGWLRFGRQPTHANINWVRSSTLTTWQEETQWFMSEVDSFLPMQQQSTTFSTSQR
ncbi:hypothetical protein V6N12_029031 [Hibiscus sabdariffa]|uniref:Uncharacterized protein n=1 Tax=Hibiscus sabdariffa TaxID=183260 RepID=A0ABR2F7K7_9ROSI